MATFTQICIYHLEKTHDKMKKCSEETQTLHAGCIRWNQKFLPRRWPKFNQLEMVTPFTDKASLVRIDACNFELSW